MNEEIEKTIKSNARAKGPQILDAYNIEKYMIERNTPIDIPENLREYPVTYSEAFMYGEKGKEFFYLNLKRMIEEIKENRQDLDGIMLSMRKFGIEDEFMKKAYNSVSLGRMWLGRVLGSLGSESPYLNDGSRKTVADIEPAADTINRDFWNKLDWPENPDPIPVVDKFRQLIGEFANRYKRILESKGMIVQNAERPLNATYIYLSNARMWLGMYLGEIRDREEAARSSHLFFKSGIEKGESPRMYKPEIRGVEANDLVYSIARVCHEANKAWCEADGDMSQKSWLEAEEWQRDSAIKGVKFKFKNPDAGNDEQHNSWMKEKLDNGWKYGKVKDSKKKTHPSLVPYDKLPEFEKRKDALFSAIVKALS